MGSSSLSQISRFRLSLLVLRILCILCKTHVRGVPVVPQVYTSVGGWHTTKVPRSKALHVNIFILLCQYVKEYSFGYIQVTTQTSEQILCQRSWGLSAWITPWLRNSTNPVKIKNKLIPNFTVTTLVKLKCTLECKFYYIVDGL